jgi:hypothetical protein
MDNTWLSILPATITIAVAIWSKKVLPIRVESAIFIANRGFAPVPLCK